MESIEERYFWTLGPPLTSRTKTILGPLRKRMRILLKVFWKYWNFIIIGTYIIFVPQMEYTNLFLKAHKKFSISQKRVPTEQAQNIIKSFYKVFLAFSFRLYFKMIQGMQAETWKTFSKRRTIEYVFCQMVLKKACIAQTFFDIFD